MQEIDSLPLEFVKEVINFVGYLKNKNGDGRPSAVPPPLGPDDDRDICVRELDSTPVAFVREVIDFVSFLKLKNTP
jgi:hypothetical protein